MILSTPLDTTWGTPLMERQPNAIHNKVKETHDPDNAQSLRTIALCDSIHAMSPFKGQGCNQALMDGLLLSSWLEKSVTISTIKVFMRKMAQRTNKKVIASRDAAKFLHSKEVLFHDEDFAGIKKESVKLFTHTTETQHWRSFWDKS